MGDSLPELEHVLRSKRGKLTVDEARLLFQCKSKALRDLCLGAGVGAGAAWLATRKFRSVYRLTIIGGAAAFTGLWRFQESLSSSVQHILGLEGSQMQAELARIMLRRHPNHKITKNLITKHVYSENVFDDSSSRILPVWRRRNFFGDSAADPFKTHSINYGHDDVDVEPKPISVSSTFASMANPFDCVFGLPLRAEKIQSTGTSTKSPRKHRHAHKRSHRKHRVLNEEAA